MGKLDGKVAIVTGSGRGLGRGYAICMAKEGCRVVTNDVDETATEVANEIKASGGKAVAVVGRVGKKDVANKLVDTAVKEFGRLDILVNNAGNPRDALLVNMEEAQWDEMMETHLRGTFLNTQAAVKYMIDNGVKGRIVNITSSAGIYGGIGQSNYAAAKAGIIGLTKSYAKELLRNGICVNAIAPAARTPRYEDVPEKVKERLYKTLRKNTIQKIPEPEDVAPTVIFLASDDAYFVTGQVISVMGCPGDIMSELW